MMMNMPESKSHNGFILIEVLLGLAILSIALLSATRAIMVAADTQGSISERSMALWSADNQLVSLQIRGNWPPLGVTLVACPQAQFQFVCQQKVIPTPNPGFRRVEIAVYFSPDNAALAVHGPRLAWLTTVIPDAGSNLL